MMRSPIGRIVLAVIGLCLASSVGARAATRPGWVLHLVTEDLPPYNFLENGEVKGITPDALREMMRRLGQAHDITLLPWQRAFELAFKDPDTCVFTTTKLEERIDKFQWVGPILTDTWVLLAKQDSTIKIEKLEDLRPYRTGTYRGDARELTLHDLGVPIDSAIDDALNAKKLEADRIQFWAASLTKAQRLAKRAHVGPFKVAFVWGQYPQYLACNRALDPDLVKRMQKTWEALEADGTVQAIAKTYE